MRVSQTPKGVLLQLEDPGRDRSMVERTGGVLVKVISHGVAFHRLGPSGPESVPVESDGFNE